MNNELTIFTSKEFGQITAIDREGEPWFVAKEIADILEYRMSSDMTRRLDEDEKGTLSMRTLGGTQEKSIVSESGLYEAIFGSKMPKAKAFKKWVKTEVLPSIRKTGSYSVKDKGQPKVQASKPPTKAQIARELRGGYSIARFFKMEGNAALLSANQMVVAEYAEFDINPLRDCGALLSAPDKIQYFTPTTLGAKVGVSAQKFNTALEAAGLQVMERGPKKKVIWSVTSLGKEHCDVINTGKKHTNGAPITQILWAESAIEFCTTLPGVGPALPEPETTTPLVPEKAKTK